MADDEIKLPPEEDGRTGRDGRYEPLYTAATVRRLLAEAVRAERERCARVAERGALLHDDAPAMRVRREIAYEIRTGGPAATRAEAPPADAQAAATGDPCPQCARDAHGSLVMPCRACRGTPPADAQGGADSTPAVRLTRAEANLARHWFDSLDAEHPDQLTGADVLLAVKLHEALGMQPPDHLRARARVAEQQQGGAQPADAQGRADARDADTRRLDWLETWLPGKPSPLERVQPYRARGRKWRAAIDAAMQAEAEQQGGADGR